VSQTRASMLVLLLAAVLGCAVGPNYQRPDMAVPQQWAHADQPGLSAGVVAVLQWWQTLKDPMLDALIERAVHANLDLRMAATRVRESRALRRVAAADQFPTVTLSSAYSRNRLSANVTTTPRSIAPEYDLFQSGFDASWELDLFGRVRRTVEAASADLAATEDNRRDVLVTLLAEVTRNYVDVRGFQHWKRLLSGNRASPLVGIGHENSECSLSKAPASQEFGAKAPGSGFFRKEC